MVRRLRRGFTPAEKSEMWDRWQRGESLSSIGRAFGKESSSIHFQISPYGGVRPAPRRRSRLALTLLEREEISRGIVARQSARSMARQLGRSPSTVSREIKRNGKELMIVLRRRFPLWVRNGPRAGPPATSGAEGGTDLDTAKADIGQRMSDAEGRADLDQTVWNFAS